MFEKHSLPVGMNRRSFLGASAVAGVAASLAKEAFAGQSPAPPPKPGQPKKLLFWDLARFDYWDNVELVQGRGVYRPEGTFEDPDGRKGRVIFPSVWKEPSGRWFGVYGKNWSPFPLCALESEDGIRWQPRAAPEVVPAGGKLAPHHVFTLDRGSGSGVYNDPIAADGFPLKFFGRQDGDPVYQRALKDPNHVWHEIAKAEGPIGPPDQARKYWFPGRPKLYATAWGKCNNWLMRLDTGKRRTSTPLISPQQTGIRGKAGVKKPSPL